MKATDLLKEDHRRVDKLFKEVKNTPKGEHPALFKQIKAELDVHAHIEETEFYPVLEAKGDKELKDITREGLEEHRQAKMFLKELDGMSAGNKQFEAKLKVLMEDIEHHVQEEEDEMFPLVEDQFSETALEKMGAKLEKEKTKFVKTLTAEEKEALKKSMKNSTKKSVVGKILETAVDVVSTMLTDGGGENEKPARGGSAKSAGSSKSTASKSGGKAKAASGGSKSTASKSSGGAKSASGGSKSGGSKSGGSAKSSTSGSKSSASKSAGSSGSGSKSSASKSAKSSSGSKSTASKSSGTSKANGGSKSSASNSNGGSKASASKSSGKSSSSKSAGAKSSSSGSKSKSSSSSGKKSSGSRSSASK